ncbi:MAG: Tol-Pal system subunit TolQ, partial [Candidatus Puniceispirillaceae bacterium]
MDSVDSFVAHSSSDLSIWGLFLAADPLVKSVMLLLVLASIWCWAIIFEKVTSVRNERRHSDRFEDAFWSGG